jgi:hypothetical protein
MLRALIEGKATPQEMAELAKRKLRNKIPELELALEGRVEEHHRFLLHLQLERLQSVEKDLKTLEQRIQEKLQPYAAQLALLDEIPGVDWTLAAVIIAELGVDMSVFQNVSQLTSWAGVCPGNNESAGKRKSSRIPKGNVHLKTALVEAANAAARAKGTYLRDKSYRLKARRGYKRAAVAIAHRSWWPSITCFPSKSPNHDLGDLYLDNSGFKPNRRTDNPADNPGAGRHSHLKHDHPDKSLYRVGADLHAVGNFLARKAVQQELHRFTLARS